MGGRSILVAAAFGCFTLLVATTCATVYPSGVGTVFVDVESGVMSFKPVLDTSGVAFGNFTDQTLHPSGFGRLIVTTNSEFNDTLQARYG